MNGEHAEEMLAALGEVMDAEGIEPVDLVICGGMALLMQGLISRPTTDIDGLALVVEEDGSLRLKKPFVSREFAAAVERVGSLFGRGKKWLNFSAILLHVDTDLPDGLLERAVVRSYGGRLTVRLCARRDMVCLKMWAALNRSGPDIGDLVEMNVSEREADEAFRWCLEQRGDRAILQAILREIGHERLAG